MVKERKALKKIVIFIAFFMASLISAAGSPKDSSLLFFDGFENGSLSKGWNYFLIPMDPQNHPRRRRIPRENWRDYFLQHASDVIEVVDDIVNNGRYSLKFTVRPGDAATKGDFQRNKERSEIERVRFGKEGLAGSEQWYGWSLYIPEDDSYRTKRGAFMILGQWHQSLEGMTQNDKLEGWATPPVSVTYMAAPDGRTGMKIAHGLARDKKIFLTPIKKGQWINWVFHIRWSKKDDGFIEGWKDGKRISPWNGKDNKVYSANLVPHNNRANSFKIGIYRGRNVKPTTSVYYDDVFIRDSPPPDIDLSPDKSVKARSREKR